MTPLGSFGLPIMLYLLWACVFRNEIRRVFRCQLSGLIPAQTPLKTVSQSFNMLSVNSVIYLSQMCPQFRKDVLKTARAKKMITVT